jgi:DNA adenine methylase
MIAKAKTEHEPIDPPYIWFGGKRKVAPLVWDALGDVAHYVEPFFGGGSVWLLRPPEHQRRLETVNDYDGFVSNFWRAVQREPEAVAHGLNWPVNEVDLEARHRALCRMPDKAAFIERMKREPGYYDVERAAWWCWGLNAWIGSGWCGGEYWPGEAGQSKGCGVCDGANKRPHLGMGQGINLNRPQLGNAGQGEHERRYAVLRDWMCAIRDRLRNVRVCCGDWERVCTDGATAHGRIVGIFLDPPYSAEANRDADIYRCEDLSVAHRVREYCIERGANPRYRLVLCGYDGEHNELERHGWRVQAWKAGGGFGAFANGDTQGKANAHRERIWFSPHCLRASEPAPPPQLALEAAT